MGSLRQKGASDDKRHQLGPPWNDGGAEEGSRKLKEDSAERAAIKVKASDPKPNTNGIKFDAVNLYLKLTNT